MSNIAYLRVSTLEQNLSRQETALESYNIDKQYIEKVSGVKRDREELNKMLDFVREGDVIYCYEISRLARSSDHLLEIVSICNDKGVVIRFIKEGISTDKQDAFSSFFLLVLSALAELERNLIKERSLEGIHQAKLNGVYTGRKPITIADFDIHYDKYMRREYKSKGEFSKEIQVSRPTLDKLIKAYLQSNEEDRTQPLVTLSKTQSTT